jgi:hypothetical protein
VPHHARIAGAECLRRKRGYGGHQPHSTGEADPEYGARQRRRGNRPLPEAPDQREIRRHHCDLTELRQRDRHRQLERFGQLDGKVTA